MEVGWNTMIKLKSLLPEGKTAWVYHSTMAKHLPNIVRKGLLPAVETNWGGDLGQFSQGKVFVTDYFNRAVYYGNCGPWRKDKSIKFKPVLRFKYDLTKLKSDPSTRHDFYSEVPIITDFWVFVPLYEHEQGDDTIFDENYGEWRKLTPEIATAIATGEWDD